MSDLKKALESLGFNDIKTLLNSGNVVFMAKETTLSLLTQQIEKTLAKTFGFTVPVLIRTKKEIQELVDSQPFKAITVTPETRLYMTFLSEKPKSALKIPYESENKGFRILRVSDHEICSAVIPSPTNGTLDMMSFLEKEFGKNVTTRNWNTVVKLAAL